MNITMLCEICGSESRGGACDKYLCYEHLLEAGVKIRKPGPDYTVDSEGRRLLKVKQ